jgi:hypothetical protein
MAIDYTGGLEVPSALERLEPAAFEQVPASVLDLSGQYFQVSSAAYGALEVE